jgi:hypothetical protein
MSLLVTLALATLGASCKRNPGHPDAAPDGPRPLDAGGVADAPRPDAVAADSRAEPDAAADVAAPRDLAPDLGADAGRPDAPLDAAATNPTRLWFHGPEGDFQLSDMEPETPF